MLLTEGVPGDEIQQMDLTYDDLLPFAPSLTAERADILIRGVTARVAQKVPCILALAATDAVRDILMAAVLRRYQAGGGLVTSQKVGEVQITMDTATSGRLLLDSELAELQAMCGAVSTGGPLYSFPDARAWPDPLERC